MPTHIQPTHDKSSTSGAHPKLPIMLQNALDPVNLTTNQTYQNGVKFNPCAIQNIGPPKIAPSLKKYHC